jgi:asparagine synthase (glutamine-hydrolysing)
MARLSRRGPDGSGQWRSPTREALLGHTRLAIIDLSEAGRQPMTDPLARIAVAFNGEIYNAAALREELEGAGCALRSRSDTEVLVHGYLHWGMEGLLRRLLGMFAFVAWDELRGECFAGVDHAGQKPLYWSSAGGALYLASDGDALRELLPHRLPLDSTGLCHVLCHGYCPPPRTVWRGMAKLGPGQALRFRPGDSSPVVWRHWTPPEEVRPADDGEAFEALWERVVEDHTVSDVPVGVFLSGGLDSTSVALALSRAGRHLPCFTLALDSAEDESPAAARSAAALGMPHARIPFGAQDLEETLGQVADSYDEPQGYGALLTAVAIARAARKHGKVMIAGDGGDEALAGYAWHRGAAETRPDPRAGELGGAVQRPEASGAVRGAALKALASLSFLHGHLQRVFPRFHPGEAAALIAPLGARYDEHTYAAWAGEHDRPWLPMPRRAQRLDLMGFCAGSILPKIDRASMGVGLELRAPFLDRRMLEFGLSRPVEAGELDGASKPLLRGYLAGRAPAEVLSRPKQGFSLRLGGDVWSGRLPRLREMRLVRDGLLHPEWESFVAPDAPYRASRIMLLCMIAAWAESRL